jgi:hypothetical protein
MLFSLSMIWYAFGIPIVIEEAVQITFFPVFSALLKFRTLFKEQIRIIKDRLKLKTGSGNISKGRRNSWLGVPQTSFVHQSLAIQMKYFPKKIKWIFLIINFGLALCLSILLSIMLARQPTAGMCNELYTGEIWRGCLVEVPFCQNIFSSKCDCAVLDLFNYSQRVLPHAFVNMSSLLKFDIVKGNLERIPSLTAKHHKDLSHLRIFKTNILTLPKSVGGFKKMVRLSISYSKLTVIPSTIGEMENLKYLDLNNNNISSIPDSLCHCKRLVSFNIGYNHISSLPKDIGSLGLVSLRSANNSLKVLPESVGDMFNLHTVDIQYNMLDDLPISMKELSRIEYFYVAGNPLCSKNYKFPGTLVNAIGLCTMTCSANCPAQFEGDGYCDDGEYTFAETKKRFPNAKIEPKKNAGCNSAVCEYDGGDCLKP